MEIRVLGDLTIDGGRLSPKERSLLAVLVLRSATVVTPSELADAVWGDDPPSTWPKQVQAFVVQIRRTLGSTAIATTRAGYRLRVDPDAIDAVRYERLIEVAGVHRANGDPARAIDALERASSLWNGVPYSDLGEWPDAIAEAERLGEIRKSADEDLQAARLECGEHRAVVPDAERLVRADPLRERRWAILATALYRSGRQADALATLRSARGRLADELGIEPGAELVALESAILHQDASLEAPPEPHLTSSDCPYRGLQPFGTDDAEEFFGRDADIQAALARLSRSPFLAVSGASGCGKSSLVLAGLVPALRARGDTVAVLGSGATPIARLRDALSGRSHADVVVIDQFEELFHSGLPDAHVAEFSALIANAVAVGQRVIVAVRADFLSSCAAEPSIGPLFAAGVHLVGPLGPVGLRSAVEEPARLAGLRLEPGLVELILRDAAGAPGVLPHVSHALVETWLRREGATLTVAGYEDSGGISGAIAKSADQLYLSLDSDARATCRATFLRLVEISADGAPMRRRIPITPMRQDAAHDRVLTSLARARLVSAEEDSLIVAHESLATAWPRLRGWLEDDAEGVRAMSALASAASTWEADGRPDEDLYRGARLNAVVAWRDAADPELTPSEDAFLEASAAHERATIDEIEHRARHDRKQNRRLRVLLAAAVALFAVAAVAGGFVAIGAQETVRERTSAQIEALTSTSLSLRDTERDVAQLLAAEAYRRWPDDARTRSALMGVLTGAHGLVGTTYLSGITEMSGVHIPGTRQVVVAHDNGAVQVFDIDSGAVVRTLDIPREYHGFDSRLGPVVSGDARRVAVAERDWAVTEPFVGTLTVADLATGDRLMGPIEFDVFISSISINRDGSMVAAIDATGALRLITANDGATRLVSGTATHPHEMDSDKAGTARFAEDGQRLYYGTVEGQLLVIDPRSAEVIETIAMPAESTNVAMSVLGAGDVITTGDRRIALVDTASGRTRWVQQFATSLEEPCPWVAASVTIGTVYCGDHFGHIAERSLETGAPTERTFEPQLDLVGPLAVTSEGRELVAVGRGEPAVTRWMLDGSGAAARVQAPGWSMVDRYDPAGSRLLIARGTGPPQTWDGFDEFAVLDTRSGELVLRLPVPSYDVSWAGAGVLVGKIGGRGEEHTAFVEVESGRTYQGDGLPRGVLVRTVSTDGGRMFLAIEGDEILASDPTTGRLLDWRIRVVGEPHDVTTSADSTELLVTTWSDTGPRTTVFDAASGKLLREAPEGIGWPAFTARDEIIGSTFNRITRFDAEDFEPLGAIPGVPGGIYTLSVSPDGRTLSVYTLSDTLSMYDLIEGIRLGDPIQVSSVGNVVVDPYALPRARTVSGMFSPDGTELAANIPAGIALWDLRPSSQAEAACRMAGRDLTEDEWRAYVADLGPYRSTCGFGID